MQRYPARAVHPALCCFDDSGPHYCTSTLQSSITIVSVIGSRGP
jgi:hypothetical protein